MFSVVYINSVCELYSPCSYGGDHFSYLTSAQASGPGGG